MRVMMRRTVSCAQREAIEAGMRAADLRHDRADRRHCGDVFQFEQVSAQAVVDVVRVIGDVVGERRRLRLRAGVRPQLEILQARVGQDRRRHAACGITRGRLAVARQQRAIVLHQAFERLPGEIKAVELRVAALQRRHNAQRLRVVVEAAEAFETGVKRALTGVAEGRMAEIVRQRCRLRQVLVEPERARERAGDLHDFERVGEPRAEMIAFVIDEHLRLVGEAAERRGVDDSVAIAPEVVARGGWRLRQQPAAAFGRIGGIRSARYGRGNGHF